MWLVEKYPQGKSQGLAEKLIMNAEQIIKTEPPMLTGVTLEWYRCPSCHKRYTNLSWQIGNKRVSGCSSHCATRVYLGQVKLKWF